MSLASFAIRTASRAAAARFEQATRDPVRTQTGKILGMVSKNADTEYGRRFGFGSIRTVEDYQSQVPVVTYEDIKADMERVDAGQRTSSRPRTRCSSPRPAGPPATPSTFPVTPTCQGREHKDVMRTWMAHALRAHPEIFGAKVVSLVSPAVEGHTP